MPIPEFPHPPIKPVLFSRRYQYEVVYDGSLERILIAAEKLKERCPGSSNSDIFIGHRDDGEFSVNIDFAVPNPNYEKEMEEFKQKELNFRKELKEWLEKTE